MKPKALAAEFIGVFALCFVGILAIHNLKDVPAGGGLVGIAIAHGLVIACLASAFGAVSGGHFNPAVTIAMLATKRIDALGAIGYIIVQVLGGSAAAVVAGMVPGVNVPGGVPALAEGMPAPVGMMLEAIATMFLVLVIFGTAVDKRGPKNGALFIGLTVVLGILAIGPMTGAALNPARHLGPALVAGGMDNFWVWLVGPILGGLAGAFLYDKLMLAGEDQPE